MTELHVRAAGPDDRDAVLALYRHLHPTEPPPAADRVEGLWRDLIGHPGLTVFVGVLPSGEFAASCTLVVIPNLTRGGAPYALIENVVTHAGHRRQGHGKTVLDAAAAAAWEAGCYKVMLMTGSTAPGTHRFYAEAGFEQSKTGYQIRCPAV